MTPEDRSPAFPLGFAPRDDWLLVLGRQAHVRTLVVTVLTQAGYIVVGYETPTEAASALQGQAAPALILFDGAAASEEALHEQLQQFPRLIPTTASSPVLLLSTAHPPPRVTQLPGAVTLLTQPFDLVQLLRLVASSSAGAPSNGLP